MAVVIQFDKFAQKLVETTSFLLGGRIVNIMNKDGYIIASTEKHRIGTVHQGAVEVMATGREVCIYPDEVERYPGAKEGINMPIIVKNEVVGVVGVFGNPDESRDIANLLKVYTEMYIRQLTYFNKQEIEDEIRTELLKFLIYGEMKGQLSFEQMTDMVGWEKIPPYACVIMKVGSHEDHVSWNVNMRNLLRQFKAMEFIDSRKILYGIVDDRLVVIKSQASSQNPQVFSERLLELTEKEFASTPVIAVSGTYEDLKQMPMVYQGLSLMAEGISSGICFMDSVEGMVDYCFQYLFQNPLMQEYGERMYHKLCQKVEPKVFQEYIQTIEAYCESPDNMRIVAEKLLIHKNTLAYRMNKIYDILGLAGLNSVCRVIQLRLLLHAGKSHRADGEQDGKTTV